MTADAKSNASTTGAAAGVGNAQQYDYGTNRSQDVDKDVGADERYEAMSADAADAWRINGKRTYDVYQSIDVAKQVESQAYESALRAQNLADMEQRRRHTEAEFNQRMRHADTANTVVAALLGDMAEKLEYVKEALSSK